MLIIIYLNALYLYLQENENPTNKNFTKPQSKLKRPENYRSSSRNRQQV